MRVVEESVEDGVAEGGIADDIVPVLDGDLAGEQRATAGIAVVEDFEEVVPPLARERSEAPVIEDEQPRPCEPLDELGIGTDPTGEGELVEEPGDAVVAGGDAEAAGLVAERTGEIGLSRPRRAGDETLEQAASRRWKRKHTYCLRCHKNRNPHGLVRVRRHPPGAVAGCGGEATALHRPGTKRRLPSGP